MEPYILNERPIGNLKDHKNLSKENVFRIKTESHRLRVPRYMTYLLTNKEFLNRFPDFRKLVPYIDEIIELGNAHDIEKSPEKINTMLTKYNGVDHSKMTKSEDAKFTKNIEEMNYSGEKKLNKIFEKLGFSSRGVLSEEARLFLALEGWVDRWDAAMFRGKEFGKTMQRVADYVRTRLIPSGFHAKYDLNLVAEMDDFAYNNPSKVNLLGAVDDIVPDNYQKLRSNFKWSSFSEIQNVYTKKLKTLYKLNSRIKPIRPVKASPAIEKLTPSVKPKSVRSLALGRLGETAGLAGAAYLIRNLNDAKTTRTDISNTVGRLGIEGVPALALSTIGPRLATGAGLFAYTSTTGDDMADRYMNPDVYTDFLKLPLEEQEIRIKGNETSAFKSVIYSRRPQILSLNCPQPNASLKAPFILNIESLERQPYEIKIRNDNSNEIRDIISESASTTTDNNTQIRFNFKSDSQVCLNLPSFSDGIFHEKNLCTQLNQRGFPELEVQDGQHIKADHWNESVKVREWLKQNPNTVKECCQRTKCREYMANKNNTHSSPDPIIKKSQKSSPGFR